MPTYEYACGTCGTFEQFQRITEDPLSDCPRCGSAVRRLISSGTGIIFKGSGFYSTDSRASGKSDDGGQSNEDGKGREASKADGESAGKDSSAGESKSDSKSDPTSDTNTKTKKKEPAAATAAKD